MYKIIKEFKKNEYTYYLGYTSFGKEVYPRIEVYKNNEMLFEGGLCGGFRVYTSKFFFRVRNSFSTSTADTIKVMFIELRKYGEIPEYIEIEFENLFLLYKLNNFKKL